MPRRPPGPAARRDRQRPGAPRRRRPAPRCARPRPAERAVMPCPPPLGRQALPTLGPAPLERHASGSRAHARSKPVHTGALALLWLVGALHLSAALAASGRPLRAVPTAVVSGA